MPSEIVSPRTYQKVFGGLLALLVLTVGANFVDLGPFNTAVAMGISVVKALLILLFFMEVRYSSRLTWLFSGAAFLWLVIMLVMMMSDYVTRPWLGPDWREGTRGDNRVEFRR